MASEGREPSRGYLKLDNQQYENLTIRWPYSLAAQRVAAFIVRWSVGWKNGRRTPSPLDTKAIADEAQSNLDVVRRELRRLKRDGIVFVDNRGRAGIHWSALDRKVLSIRTVWSSEQDRKVTPVADNLSLFNDLRARNNNNSTTEQKTSGPLARGCNPKCGKRNGKSRAQLVNDEDVEDVMAIWRGLHTEPIDEPFAGKILQMCRAVDRGPHYAILKSRNARQPKGWIISVLTPGPKLLDLTDSGQSMGAWDARKNGRRIGKESASQPMPIGDTVGEILRSLAQG